MVKIIYPEIAFVLYLLHFDILFSEIPVYIWF